VKVTTEEIIRVGRKICIFDHDIYGKLNPINIIAELGSYSAFLLK